MYCRISPQAVSSPPLAPLRSSARTSKGNAGNTAVYTQLSTPVTATKRWRAL